MFQTTTAIPVFEGYSAESNGDIIAITESYEDQLKIIRSLHTIDKEDKFFQQDLKALRESGAEEYEIESRQSEYESVMESAIGNAWEKIKAFFKNLFGKIKAFFASVMRSLTAMFSSAEDFAKKYEPQIRKLDLIGFEYALHTYTLDMDITAAKLNVDDEVAAAIDSAVTQAPDDIKLIKDWDDDKEKMIGELRAACLGESGELDADELKEKIFSKFRGGADHGQKPDERKVELSKIISELKGSSKLMNNAKKAEQQMTSGFTKIISKIDSAEKKVSGAKEKDGNYTVNAGKHEGVKMDNDKHTNALKVLQASSAIVTETKNIMLQVFKGWKSAFEERNREYKSCILAAFRYKREK